MVDSYIASLFCLAEHCEYGPLHNEMIRDRIVVGIVDSSLSLKLQLDATLTLKKAIDAARQSEAAKREQAQMRSFLPKTSSSTVGETSIDQPKMGSYAEWMRSPNTLIRGWCSSGR